MTKEYRVEEVHCREIDNTRIYYDCIYCEKQHYHGNAGELDNYIHHRGCHCRHPNSPTDVTVIVDDETVRKFTNK